MNWHYILMTVLGLLIFFVVVATVLLYLQHRLVRLYRKASEGTHHPIQGRYFRRFLPKELKPQYKERIDAFEHTKAPKFTASDYRWHAVVVAGSMSLVGWFIADHWYEFFEPVKLTLTEARMLNQENFRLANLYADGIPQMSRFTKGLRDKRLILLESPPTEDRGTVIEGVSRVALEQWSLWAQGHGMKVVTCRTDQWDRCSVSRASPHLTVVLPGHWEAPFLDGLLKSGESFILYGMPTAALETGSSWKWNGLEVEASQRTHRPTLVLSGDRPLTLGFDAGQQLAVVPFDYRFRAKSPEAEAYAVPSDQSIGSAIETRLWVHADKGRVVWMDFSPNVKDQPAELNREYFGSLLASILRYLSKEPYSAMATWPGGAKFAAMMSLSLDDEYESSGAVQSLVKSGAFPLTTFLVSDYVQKKPKLFRSFSAFSEVACGGDSRLSFIQDAMNNQVRRLALCGKVLSHLLGRRPAGFLPPEEHFNDDTVTAAINVDFAYLFSRFQTDRAVPQIRRVRDSRRQIVELPRVTSNDFYLKSVLGMNPVETEERIDREITWMKLLSGLYSFNFSSSYLADPSQLDLIGRTAGKLKGQGVFFATAQDLATWWTVRSTLVSDLAVEGDLRIRFQPKRLTVDASGTLQREDW